MSFLIDIFTAIARAFRSKYRWMAILFFVWLYRVDFMPADGGGVAKGIQVGSLFLMTMMVMGYRKGLPAFVFSRGIAPIRTATWLYTFAMLSTAWAFSVTFAFFLSVQNIVLLMVLVWFFALFRDFRSMEKAFLTLAVIIMLFEVLMVRILGAPVLFIHYLPGGSSAAICISYCMGELLKESHSDKARRSLLKGTAVVSLIVLVTSTSSGANASAVAGVAFALFFSGRLAWALLLMAIAATLYAFPDLSERALYFIMPGKTKEEIETGTGRETIWEGLMAVTAQRPLYGWGYACGERVASEYLDWTLSDAHNNWLGIYSGLGLTGVALLIIHQVSTLLTAFTKRMKRGCTGLLCALACATVNGYSYGYLSGKACSITILYFAMLVLLYFYPKLSASHGQAVKR